MSEQQSVTKEREELELGRTPEEIRDAAKNAIGNIELYSTSLAECLFHIYQRELYKEWGFPKFEIYVVDELDIRVKKSYELINIWGKFSAIGVTYDVVKGIPYSKLKIITRVVTSSNYLQWFSMARMLTSKELLEKIKDDAQSPGLEEVKIAPKMVSMKIRLGVLENKLVTEAVEEAARLIDSKDIGIVISTICDEWLQFKGTIPQKMTVQDYIDYVKNSFGVVLVEEMSPIKSPKLQEEEELQKIIGLRE
jgi:hypothetical protein